ncbi:hypothetical protein BJX61DRAFT_501575 [Aspergillus egyptiacus]|nr:hypothetical protein BJX61DRAFT_501575 [Aspergillus egyptiacus]
MDQITKRQFQNTLAAAVRQRSIRYTESYSLSLRWEADSTGAVDDARQFQAILGLLNLPAAQELVLAVADQSPGWTLEEALRKILNTAILTQGRALIIIHYAGHALTKAGEFCFAEGAGKQRIIAAHKFVFSEVLPPTYEESYASKNVDVLFILDCCYASTALRTAETSDRIIEFIAASDDGSPRANSRPAMTLTNKLFIEIRRRRQEQHQYVEIADVVQTLRTERNVQKRPAHSLSLGATSICLPFTGLRTVDPSRIQPSLRAVFKVNIIDNMTKQDVERFIDWIRTLPDCAAISLEGVYETDSMCVILQGAWAVWSKLSNMRGYTLITEARGPNLAAVNRAPPPPAPPLKENVSFFGKKTR